ncbi:MAG: porin, partial [Methylococcales bacterium]|nr:porin [Methylococcales bacterium]
MSKKVTRAVSLATLGAVAVLGSTQVMAADRELLEMLRQNGAITQKQFELLTEKKVASDASVISAVKDTQYKISTGKKGLSIESTDGAYAFGVGGRVQTDVNFFFPNSEAGNGMEARRVRLKGYGKLAHDWKYKAEIDFSEYSKIDLTDGWLAYTGFDDVTIKVGHQKVPFSFQSENSSNWQTFQERAQTDAFIDTPYLGRRRMGLTVAYDDDLFYGRAGAFAAGINEDGEFNQSFGTAARGLVSLVNDKDQHFHVGGSVHYRDMDDNPGGEDADGNKLASKDGVELRFKYHPEAHIGGTWIDSGSDLSEDSILAANAEIAGYLGPLHGQAEFTTMNVERTGGLTDLNFYSYYAEVGYFLTGEQMNWKQSVGQWKRVKVGHEVGNGGIGA